MDGVAATPLKLDQQPGGDDGDKESGRGRQERQAGSAANERAVETPMQARR